MDLESSFMQVQSSIRGPGELPREFAHLHEDMVKHHFLQWQRLNTHVWRGRGHQFRCAAEYIFEKASIASWYGWCQPTPEIKKFKGEAVTLITDIPRWQEKKDVALDIQTRWTIPGRPAQIQLSAGVLRIKRRITRAYLVEQLQGQYAGELEYIFFKGRIWSEDSTTEITVSHCDTFTILSRREIVPSPDDLLPRSTGEDTATCLDDEAAGRGDEPSRSGALEEQEELESSHSLSDDSFSWQNFGLCTFMVGTPEGVRRYDALFRFDLPDETIFEMLSLFLRSDIDVEELLQSQGLAVDKQRIFIVIMEAPSGAKLSLQRRLRGYESETFKILRFRGKVTFDTYSAHFIEESPLEVHLGMSTWTTASYRNLHAGSLVTVMLPDPQGGAYSFLPSERAESSGFSLLQLAARRMNTGTAVAQQASGNAEEATRDLCKARTVHERRRNFNAEIFDRLPPPGNPKACEERLSLQPERSSAARVIDEAQSRPGSPELHEILDDKVEEFRHVQHPKRCAEVLYPADLGATMALIAPWCQCPLQLHLPNDCTFSPISLQFVYRCVAGWRSRIKSVHIYTDGSKGFHDDRTYAGFAFTVFGFDPEEKPNHFFLGWFAHELILKVDHPYFTGALECTAKEAEASALLWATIWLLQSGIRVPTYFHYDAMSVGNVMMGQWNLHPCWLQGGKLRELMLFCQSLRLGCSHDFEHCKAHSLQPCNELTDILAKAAGLGNKDIQQFEEAFTWGALFQNHDHRLAWAWWNITYLYSKEYPHRSQETLHIEHQGLSVDTTKVKQIEYGQSEKTASTKFWLRVGSFNILTLHSKREDGEIISETMRAKMLKQQLQQGGYHVVGLQETRCNVQTVLSGDGFVRVTSGQDEDKPGHWGCELWFCSSSPVARAGKDSLHIDPKCITVLWAHPRLLVAHVRIGGQTIVFASAHAPHEGSAELDKQSWWDMLHHVYKKYRNLDRWCILGDFNARIGQTHEEAVGSFLIDEEDNHNGERLGGFCVDNRFWIPSTFPELHVGTPFTWTHPRGGQARIDYVLLSEGPWTSITSYVDLSIVTSNASRDHELVGADIGWCVEAYSIRQKCPTYDWEMMHTAEGKRTLQAVVDNLPSVDWTVDVHEHWQILEDSLHQGLREAFPSKPKILKKDIITGQSWALRDDKMAAKDHLYYLDDAVDDLYLWITWNAWVTQTPVHQMRRKAILLVAMMETARLMVLSHFRLTAKKLRLSLAKDKANFLDQVVRDAGNCRGADIFKALRPLRIGSAIKKRGLQALPFLVDQDGVAALDEDARDQVWGTHCATLEAGVATTTRRLLQRTRRRTEAAFELMPANLELTQVPSLTELEGCFRRIKPRKAAGTDGIQSDICGLASVQLARKFHPILMKLYLKGEEPIQCKGGRVVAAYKHGPATDINNYRNLLLSSHLGKALRRTIRQRLIPYYSQAAGDYHLSVRHGGSVSQASQALKLTLAAARARGLSAGVIFLDVRAAYYRVIRELVVNMNDDGQSFQRMLRYFQLGDTEEVELMAAVSDGDAARAIGIPEHLCALLRETLSNTWFVTERRNTVYECLAGSRPGDGLADVVFAIVFRKILACVRSDFEEQYGEVANVYQGHFDAFEETPVGGDVPSFLDVVWADDLALVVTHKSASTLVERLRFTASRTFHHCLRHALTPNLKKGKTELLLYLRGAGSKQIKGDIFNQADPFLNIEGVPEEFQKVLISVSYRHLGSRVHLGKTILPEIKERLGAASSIYRKHRRAIFQNRLLPLERRRYLLQTMVLSIVRYNTGTWGELSRTESKYYMSRMMALYRGLLRATIPDTVLRFWNNGMIIDAVGLPDPMQLLHEARLSFAVSMATSGPVALWGLAAVEMSWLRSLRSSKEWLHSNLKGSGPDRFGNVWNPDYWQEIKTRPAGFKRWIRKASYHANLQHAVRVHWNEWHHDFLKQLIDNGYPIPFPWPTGEQVDDIGEACLACHRTFVNRAAWSVHAFKQHQRVNDKRALVFGTRCEACMREFVSEDRLQRHLNYKQSCAVKLRHEGLIFPVQPGINSAAQRRPLTYPVPVLPTMGPQRQWQPEIHQQWDDGVLDDFEEELFECIQEMERNVNFLDAVEEIKKVFGRSCYAFTDLKKTFLHFRDVFPTIWTEHRDDELHVTSEFVTDLVTWVYKKLHLRWFFTEEECATLPGAEELREAAWQHSNGRKALDDHVSWKVDMPIPRFGHLQLVIVHLFAGEQREGDLQQALHQMVIPDGFNVVILAVDIIYDRVRADLSTKSIQEQWILYIRKGFVLALFGGPPCESWSRSRQSGGVPEVSIGDGGPRVIRNATNPQGLSALRPREVLQLKLANCLLCFALQAFLEMCILGRFAMLEHPACPSQEGEGWLASIWRLYVVQVVQLHPWTQLTTIMQGHYGAVSPKPTTLLFALGQCFDVEKALYARRVTHTLPKALVMGKGGDGGEYSTSALKNYPPGLCRALSGILEQWMGMYVQHHFVPTMDESGFTNFLQFVQNLQIHFNFSAMRGADFAQ